MPIIIIVIIIIALLEKKNILKHSCCPKCTTSWPATISHVLSIREGTQLLTLSTIQAQAEYMRTTDHLLELNYFTRLHLSALTVNRFYSEWAV